MKNVVPGPDPENPAVSYTEADALAGAKLIADAYVQVVLEHTPTVSGRTDALFGYGGKSSWLVDFDGDPETYNCEQWSTAVFNKLKSVSLEGTGWRIYKQENAKMLLTFNAYHNFVMVSFRGHEQNGKISTPNAILDPWPNGRPDVFDPKYHLHIWKSPMVDTTLDPE